VKIRKEARGIHVYDRVTGVHVLVDERPVPVEECDEGPAVLSVALTNACDLECDFCYAPKTPHALGAADVLDWCVQADKLGTLEVAFGGGEPTLYRPLAELCRTIWSSTGLGISITSHGHHLSRGLVDRLTGTISVLRVSVDAPEPTYSAIRGRSFERVEQNLEYVRGRIPFGINTVVNDQTVSALEPLAARIMEWGATDWLLLPEVSRGVVTADATQFLGGPFLFLAGADFDYAHISADGFARLCSYSTGGVSLRDTQLAAAFRQLRAA
jgi:MoaA/NifB/PqqE/SkfB family radical SAM enzyme